VADFKSCAFKHVYTSTPSCRTIACYGTFKENYIMKTKKILILFLACILLISCKPTSKKQNEGQESIVTEEQDSLTSEEQEFLASLDSVMDSYEEEVIVVVDKNRKSDL